MKKSPKYSHIQLAFLGFVALSIGIVCMLDVTLVYGLPVITSISESATTGNSAGMLLPFALGCMFTFCISYMGYCRAERILTRFIAIGFFIAAMQICESVYVISECVGLLGLSPEISNMVHTVGAIVGFGAMFIWIAFFFTRGVPNPTREKMRRNNVYVVCATFMASGIVLFFLGMFDLVGKFNVLIAEEFILIPAGVALIVKSGFVMKDKQR